MGASGRVAEVGRETRQSGRHTVLRRQLSEGNSGSVKWGDGGAVRGAGRVGGAVGAR